MTYAEAIRRFGVDNPDLRFGLELVELSDLVKGSGFKVFADVCNGGGMVKGLNAKGCARFSRKEIDELTQFVTIYGAKGLAYVKIENGEWHSPIAKFFSADEISCHEPGLRRRGRATCCCSSPTSRKWSTTPSAACATIWPNSSV